MPAKIFINRYLMKNYLKYYIIQKICHFAFICSMIFAPNERDPTENKLLFNEEEKYVYFILLYERKLKIVNWETC